QPGVDEPVQCARVNVGHGQRAREEATGDKQRRGDEQEAHQQLDAVGAPGCVDQRLGHPPEDLRWWRRRETNPAITRGEPPSRGWRRPTGPWRSREGPSRRPTERPTTTA